MQPLTTLFSFILTLTIATAQGQRQLFDFEFEGVLLNGVLNIPTQQTPKGLVLIVHGSGATKAVEQEWYQDVRQTILQAGYATYMWDKMGCGKSGGTFDYNQTVQNSALEVISAIKTLQHKQVPGSDKIGLWGVSRAGWINPIVINQYPDIEFWISVSGVDDKENFKYLLEQNLRINGHPQDTIQLIVDEWSAGVKISHSGGSYETYLAATPNLRSNKFMTRFMNSETTEQGYYDYQSEFMQEKLDKTTGLPVYIEDFTDLLSNIKMPVLALFGEQDMNVDWTKTKALYEQTIAPNGRLTTHSFPACNHNMFKCKTGGFFEMQDHNLPWKRCDGFLEAMANWLKALE